MIKRVCFASVPLVLLPWALAAQNFAYVSNEQDHTVSVIATSSNTVVAVVPVGGAPYRLAITPDGSHAYVTNDGDNTPQCLEVGCREMPLASPALKFQISTERQV